MTSREDLLSVASSLSRSGLFSAIELNDLVVLAASARPYTCPAGTVVFQEKERGDRVFLLRQGTVRIFLNLGEGEETTIALIGPGEIFGEFSLLDGEPRSASAQAVDGLQAITIGREDFLSFLRGQPEAAIRITAVLTARLRRSDDLLADAMSLGRPVKLVRHLVELAHEQAGRPGQGEVRLPLTLEELVHTLEINQPRVRFYLDWLQERGLVDFDGSHVTVRDLGALASISRQ